MADFFGVFFLTCISYSIIVLGFFFSFLPECISQFLCFAGCLEISLRLFPVSLPLQNLKVSREKTIRIGMFTFAQHSCLLLTEMDPHVCSPLLFPLAIQSDPKAPFIQFFCFNSKFLGFTSCCHLAPFLILF